MDNNLTSKNLWQGLEIQGGSEYCVQETVCFPYWVEGWFSTKHPDGIIVWAVNGKDKWTMKNCPDGTNTKSSQFSTSQCCGYEQCNLSRLHNKPPGKHGNKWGMMDWLWTHKCFNTSMRKTFLHDKWKTKAPTKLYKIRTSMPIIIQFVCDLNPNEPVISKSWICN
jgi:hypothetical protein